MKLINTEKKNQIIMFKAPFHPTYKFGHSYHRRITLQ